jgi:hypothetical protein
MLMRATSISLPEMGHALGLLFGSGRCGRTACARLRNVQVNATVGSTSHIWQHERASRWV